MAESDEQAGDVEERFIDLHMAFVAQDQPPEMAQPGKGAFDFPAPPVAPQRAAILRGFFLAPAPMRADEFDLLRPQMLAQTIAVVGPVGDEPGDLAAVLARYALERVLDGRDFRRAGFDQSTSQRNTLAVDHHHPLHALAPLGV